MPAARLLLDGEPGSGKTSFAATLANDLGLDTYEILHSDSEGRNRGLGRLIPAGQVDELASSYVTSAGGISMVLRNLKDMSPKPREVPALLRSLMKPHCELMGTESKDDFVAPARDYSLEGMNIRGDIGLGNA